MILTILYIGVCNYIKLTWYSDSFFLHDQCIDGHKIKWQINTRTKPAHRFKPKTMNKQNCQTELIIYFVLYTVNVSRQKTFAVFSQS